MAFSKRIYGKGEQPNEFHSLNGGPNKFNRYFYLRVGKIVEIDYDRYKFKIEWIVGGNGSPDWVPISFPYVGPGSCIGAMPELNSTALFGFIDEGSGGKGTPMCLSYLPIGLQTALEHNPVKAMPDQISSEEQNVSFTKFRKMQKGDLIMTSLYGGQLFLNNDIELKDSMNDSILLRRSDQSIISTSLNHFQFSDGVAIAAGQVIRNKLPIFDVSGQRIPNQLAREVTLPDGRDVIYLTPFGSKIDDSSQYFAEYRVTVEDLVNGDLDINDINSQTASNRSPIVAMALGNYVGSVGLDPRYGKILRPVLFNSPTDGVGQFNLTQCVQNKGVDEVKTLGLAYAIHLLKNDALFGFDKEGHCYLNLGASTSANPLGAGRSMSILGSGNLKEIWGQNTYDGNSWDLTTKGGIKWVIGSNNVKGSNRSIDIKAASGMKLEIRNEDADAYAKQELIFGKQNVVVSGADTKTVKGNATLTVDGLRTEIVNGSASYQYQSDKTESILGVYTQTVTKEMQGKFGKRKETVLQGQALEILAGDNTDTITTFGNKKTSLTLGNIEESIIAGNRKISIKTGNYTLDILAGNINITTKAGKATIDALGGVTISGLAGVTVKGSTVNLGMSPLRGGVITSLSHLDYTTGIPLRGSLTVKAGL